MSPEASDMDPAGFTLEWRMILAAWWFQPMLNNMKVNYGNNNIPYFMENKKLVWKIFHIFHILSHMENKKCSKPPTSNMM
jgi:hypothetical protein